MGKKVGKKARSASKVNKVAVSSTQKAEHHESNHAADVIVAADGNSGQIEKKACAHVARGIDLARVSSKLESRGPFRCENCREVGADKRAARGKGKHGKNKGGGKAEGNSVSKAIWICLECGQFSCGGIGLPTIPQCHALRHNRQTRHPLVIQVENPQLRWCFPCSTLVPVDSLEENGEVKEALSCIVKLIKREPPKQSSVDVEDVWFGVASVAIDAKSGLDVSSSVSGGNFQSRVVRGLVNLRNTCFFNSVVQNLLAVGRLREYLLTLDGSIGPLTNALRKLFIDTGPGMVMGNVISPKALLGCVHEKAPQFRGYQQHDSHELLRCLLDGLSTEELCTRRVEDYPTENGGTPISKPTFVDTIFGGQHSSTIRCAECGYSSVVFEPFLDLSLPVPTKKPPSKKARPVMRDKKGKFPPKPLAKARAKDSKDPVAVPAPDSSCPSVSDKSASRLNHGKPPAEQNEESVGCPPSADIFGYDNVVGANLPLPQNYIPTANFTEILSTGDYTWLDYLEPESFTDHQDSICGESTAGGGFPAFNGDNVLTGQAAPENAVAFTWFDNDYTGPTTASNDLYIQSNESSLSKDAGTEDTDREVAAVDYTATSNRKVDVSNGITDVKQESCNSWEDEQPLGVLDSQVLLLPYKEESVTGGNMMKDFYPSSSVVGGADDFLDFDGFGGLFDEPEVTVAPSVKPSSDFQRAEGFGSRFLAGNSSESDPDEVDDSNSPVSVESCLALFTKPDFLTGEQSWHCESCTRELLKKRVKSSQNQIKEEPVVHVNKQVDESFSNDITGGKSASMVPLLNADAADKIRAEGEEENELIKDADFVMIDVSDCLGTSGQAGLNSNGFTSSHGSTKHVASPCSIKILESAKCDPKDDGEEVNKPGSVKVLRDATKTMLISKSPCVLTIHLKRFIQDAGGSFRKLNGHVGFKETINLGPFMDPRCVEGGQCIYRLSGVVEHHGSMKHGHYVAYVRGCDRDGGKPAWYYTSDTDVRETSLENVLRSEAYLLFYEKT
ncbi:hypothetical protein Droror1_Dr00015257 [Drosera rotundifolia]